jgi:aminopeptidase N
MAFVAAAIPFGAAAAEREQLPPGVIPIHYDLAMVPDADRLTFSGRVQITIDVKATTPAIVLNSNELVLDKVLLDRKTLQLRSRSTPNSKGRRSRSLIPCQLAPTPS